MKLKDLILSSSSLLFALSAFGWGQKGHDIVAYIAECNLTPTAKIVVDSILGGKTMVYYANWADNACHTEPYAYTKTWHYKNVDENENYATAPTIPEGNIVTALNSLIPTLSNPGPEDDEKLALMLTIHFLGDIHQPMHLGRKSDRGGNNHKVKYFYSQSNLHSIWDTKVLEKGHNWSYTEWRENIDRPSAEERAMILSATTPDEWAEESYEIAKKIYAETPQDVNLLFDYTAEWTPVIEQQLLRGGLRLAALLNGIYDPEYKREGCGEGNAE